MSIDRNMRPLSEGNLKKRIYQQVIVIDWLYLPPWRISTWSERERERRLQVQVYHY